MRLSSLVPAVLLVTCFCVKSVAQNYPVDPKLGFPTGPAVGASMPDFSLTDQNGHVRSLSELVGQRGAVILFLRSASW